MLKGKSALITGSLDGIGFAIAQALARNGCAVMLNGFGDDALVDARVQTLRDDGRGRRLPRRRSFGAGADRGHGRGDASAASAPSTSPSTMRSRARGATSTSCRSTKWDYAVAVNLTAPFHVIRLTMPGMKRRKWGRIINLASNYGIAGTTRRADYVSTKHGLVGLTKVAALEGLPYNITANAICPGATLTPNARKLVADRMAAKGLSEEDATTDYLSDRQPSRRFIAPEKVGAFAAFLCSEDASEITGTPLAIDGGWLAFS